MNTPNIVEIYKKDPNFFSQLGGYGMISIHKLNEVDNTSNNVLFYALQKVLKKNNVSKSIFEAVDKPEPDMKAIQVILSVLNDPSIPRKEVEKFINYQNSDGDTVGHIAIRYANMLEKTNPQVSKLYTSIVKELVKLGLNLSIVNNDGQYIESDGATTDIDINPAINTDSSSPNFETTADFSSTSEYLQKELKEKTKQNDEINKKIAEMLSNKKEQPKELPDKISSTNSSSYNPPKIINYTSPSFNSPELLDMISTELDDIFIIQNGGNNNHVTTEITGPNSLSEISTDTVLQVIQKGGKYSDSEIFRKNEKKIVGSRKLLYNIEFSSLNSEGGSIKKEKKSTLIHNEVVQIIQDLGYTLDEAKLIKAALYQEIKNKYPELNNLDRAIKMREKASDKKLIASIDIETIRKAIEEKKGIVKPEPTKKVAKKTTKKVKS